MIDTYIDTRNVIEFEFPVAETFYDVPHKLNKFPQGYFVIMTSETGTTVACDYTKMTTKHINLACSKGGITVHLLIF